MQVERVRRAGERASRRGDRERVPVSRLSCGAERYGWSRGPSRSVQEGEWVSATGSNGALGAGTDETRRPSAGASVYTRATRHPVARRTIGRYCMRVGGAQVRPRPMIDGLIRRLGGTTWLLLTPERSRVALVAGNHMSCRLRATGITTQWGLARVGSAGQPSLSLLVSKKQRRIDSRHRPR